MQVRYEVMILMWIEALPCEKESVWLVRQAGAYMWVLINSVALIV